MDANRQQELLDLYAQLKERCLLVDDKYSLVATEPHLDMPESLNLQKLVFTPKDEDELLALAEQQVEAAMIPKERSVEHSYQSTLKNISAQKDKEFNKAEVKRNDALEQLNAEHDEIERKVADNGLYFSSVAEKYKQLAQKKYSEILQTISQQSNADQQALSQRETYAEELYDQQMSSIADEREARTQNAYQKLCDEEEKRRISIEKYNNSLEEKEQKYQASRAKAYEMAFRVQQNKALQNAKIYSELGEVGFRDLIQKEKYEICITFFNGLTRSEGNALLSFDSFLMAHLGSYYQSLADWVNTALIPD